MVLDGEDIVTLEMASLPSSWFLQPTIFVLARITLVYVLDVEFQGVSARALLLPSMT